MNIRPEIQDFLSRLEPAAPEPSSEDIIEVSSATKRIAFAYERFRNTLEPDEEEILRRRAISRILERRLFEDRPPATIATTLLQELIRGNYIKPPPRSLAVTVGRYLKKGKQIYAQLERKHQAWLLEMITVAIDHQLFSPHKQEALVHLMYNDIFHRVVWTSNFVAEKDRPTQLYLTCHRALFAADKNELAYHYFIHQFPVWSKDEISNKEVDRLLQELPLFHDHIEEILNHVATDRLTRLLRPASVPYLILRDVISAQQNKPFSSDEAFEVAVREAFDNRVHHIRGRMTRRAWHSILFLFLTKTLLALFIEIPYERYLLGDVHYLALASNIAFHPLLLFILATTVRFPGHANSDAVMEQLKRIVTGEGELPNIAISAPRRYGTATWSAFAIIYAILFMLIFWGLFSFLDSLDFSLLAMFFFVIFLGLVSFLATRIRRSADDIRVISRREGALSAILGFLALPILEFGRWLAQNIRQINVLLFLMDRVLEAPFKLLIDIAEEWFDFVRDRREEIIK
ncbi:MAG: hypothetical protein ABIH36_03115 [bacterium]